MMKKLLNTLYIIHPDSYLSLDGENVVVLREQKECARFPLHNLEGILCFGYTGASPALMGKCAKSGISLTFLNPNGRFLSRITGEVNGNVTLRKSQYRFSDDPFASLRLAKRFLLGKIYNARWVLERATRDYPQRIDILNVKSHCSQLVDSLSALSECSTYESLLGIEGEAASCYFSVFDELILQQKDDFKFSGRNRRPPLDKVNALLSFVYTLLAHDCASALEGVGLDSYVGFLHKDRPGRISLALDVMEELRSVMADRFVLSLINRKIIKPNGFAQKESGAVIMDDTTRKTVLQAWQERKQDSLTHPFLEEKIKWGLVPHTQALLLARYLRGDLDDYPPFLWK